MKRAQITIFMVLAFQLTLVKTDYSCLCSYDVETKIYDAASAKGNVIGFMYEFDCKPIVKVGNTDKTFETIGHEHQVPVHCYCFPIWASPLHNPSISFYPVITETSQYNFDLLIPHFYIVKLGFTGVYIIFLISAQKHRLWVFVLTRRF